MKNNFSQNISDKKDINGFKMTLFVTFADVLLRCLPRSFRKTIMADRLPRFPKFRPLEKNPRYKSTDTHFCDPFWTLLEKFFDDCLEKVIPIANIA